jgi:hypothetical protein
MPAERFSAKGLLAEVPRAGRSLRPFVLLITLLVTCSCFCQDGLTGEARILSGTWVLKSIYPTQNVEGPSRSQQRSLLGSSIILKTHSLEACGESIPITSVKTSEIGPSDFLEHTRGRFIEIGIETPTVTEIVINNRESGTCLGAFPLPGQVIYIKGKNELLIYFEGVFYRAMRKQQVV